MGIPKDLFFNSCKIYLDSAKNILELGAQHYLVDNKIVGYFKNLFNYPITSLDMNGENGSLVVDLSKEIQLVQKFDLITNFGTTEHVSNQFQCWKNIHYLLEDDGIIINEIPEIDAWKNHCRYYVDKRFFESMHKDFEIVDYKQIYYPKNGNLCFCIMKKKSSSFLTTETELMEYVKIIEESVDKISF